MNSPNVILRQPTHEELTKSQLAQFMEWLSSRGGAQFKSYADLYQWSIRDVEAFWEAVWNWGGVISHAPYQSVLASESMPGAQWFSGAKLNFAENLLQFVRNPSRGKIALRSISEHRPPTSLIYTELSDQVALFADYLKSIGVKKGDRVAGILSNGIEGVVAMLATTSLGAIWSSCSPDFGVRGIVDRFGQIAPKVLFAVDGYRYNGKEFNIVERVDQVSATIPSIRKVILVEQLGHATDLQFPEVIRWKEIQSSRRIPVLEFEPVSFDHPAYILFSSGTTGVPKCIVHGGGGTLLQHIKELRLHTNLSEDDRFAYYTTLGWMMWNWMVSGLITGASIILIDGSPSYPTLNRLWEMIDDEHISVFGTSAKFISSCRVAGLSPKEKFKLTALKTVLSTGSPLLPEDFDWVYGQAKDDVLLSSISGGTDIVSCFVLGNPLLPVRRGEIQCKGLGMAVEAWDESGKSVVGKKGELVCVRPAPSMPVAFWNDPDGSKYRNAYFADYPGVWRHGDYIQFTDEGGSIIYGRSDATLNPGGVRIGTAEIYRQVETVAEVQDSLAVGHVVGGDEHILLFVVLKSEHLLTPELETKIKDKIRKETTPRHVPWKVFQIHEIPYTMSGKKVELAVAKILRGEEVKNREALSNPKSLDQFKGLKI